MGSVTLTLKSALSLRVDLRGITPAALAGLARHEIEALPVTQGRDALALADLFTVTDSNWSADGVDELVFEGDLSRADRIGWQLGGGRVVVHGDAGDYVGGGMKAGEIHVDGNAGALAACELAGGTVTIVGDVGEYAASTLPGSMDGMRGGTFIVHGNAGDRFADRMRRGSALVHGRAGDFLASRMVAGTVAVGGGAGAHVGYGMRRGSVVLVDAAGAVAPGAVADTFVPAIVDAAVFWQLLSRDLARHGGPFAGLDKRRVERHLGDLGVGGKGELIYAR